LCAGFDLLIEYLAMPEWFLLSAVALVFFGATGVTQKLSTDNISFEMSFIWFSVAIAVISLVTMLWKHMESGMNTSDIALAALGGFLNGLGALTSFAALEKGGKASVVIPIINLYPLVTIAAAWIFLGERLTRTQLWGIGFAVVAVIFLSQEKPPEPARKFPDIVNNNPA
jgi:drug/metabolite transporter (DMT)-like permease